MSRATLSSAPTLLEDIRSGDLFAYTEKGWLRDNNAQVYLVIKSVNSWSWYNISNTDLGVVMNSQNVDDNILNSFLNKDSYTFMSNITLVSTALAKKLLQS